MGDRRAAHGMLALNDAQWRDMVETMADGFVVAEVLRDSAGGVADWRFVYVNRAFAIMTDRAPAELVGCTFTELFPHAERDWVSMLAGVVDTGGQANIQRRLDARPCWFEARSNRLDEDRFAFVFRDTTDEVQAQRRRDAVIAIGDALRDLPTIAQMTRVAATIVGQTLDVTRAGYGRMDADARTVDVEPDWTAPGIKSITGHYRFEDFGHIRDDLARGEVLVIQDVRTDPRTAHDPAPLQSVDVCALVNVPVKERGKPVAILIVHDNKPRRWAERELAFLRNVADRIESGVARLHAEAQRHVLSQELSHRLKNTMAMVHAVAAQTLKGAADRTAMEVFEGRLDALARAHGLLFTNDWASADLGEVIRRGLSAFARDGQVVIAGPPVLLGSDAALSAAMLVHELATNATKYGALSTISGHLDISWEVAGGDLVLRWRESGGPIVVPPTRRGLGSRLIGSGLGGGGVELDYAPAGLYAILRSPLERLSAG